MIRMIFRSLIVNELNKNNGILLYDTAMQWLEKSKFAKEESVKKTCNKTAEEYFEEARVKLKFRTIEEMQEYYKKHNGF